MSSKSNSTSSSYKNEIKAELNDLRPFKCVGDIPIKIYKKDREKKKSDNISTLCKQTYMHENNNIYIYISQGVLRDNSDKLLLIGYS